MLIDTTRIEDFLKTHSCHIINEGEGLEDKITYANFNTNIYESVFKQLQIDIEVEKVYDALEDVLFIEDEDGNLVLASPYKFTIDGRTYSYDAETPREPIWEDLFKIHSKKAEFIYSTEYEDTKIDSNKNKTYMNILNNQELKEKYDTGEIKIPDNIISSFIKEKYVFKIDNKKEKDILDYNLARNPLINYTGIIPEYNKDMPYVYMDKKEVIYSDFVDALRQRGIFLFTDFSKTLVECKKMFIQNQYESLCFEDKILHNENERIAKVIDDFCNGLTAIRINSQKELNKLIKMVNTKVNCQIEGANIYFKEYPYYYVDKTNTLDAVYTLKYLLTGDYCCNLKNENITRLIDFNRLNCNLDKKEEVKGNEQEDIELD